MPGPLTSAVIVIALMLATASTGRRFGPGEWYESLERPSWTPPRRAFPIIWGIIYLLVGTAGWMVMAAGEITLTGIWAVQLVPNALWSFLFFGRRQMKLALANITAMLLLILLFIALAAPGQPLAALLFVPYALWVTTAATLNFQLIRLNPHQGSGPAS